MSESRERVFKFIKQFIAEKGYAPTHQEICFELNMTHTPVAYHLQKLKEEGKITFEKRKARTIRVLEGAK